MPTYDYACEHCGHTFEAFQSMRDDRLKTCPKCGKARLKRLLGTGAGLIFKGSGFYITDYKKAGAAKKEGSEAKPGETKPAEPKKTSSESKPASDSKPANRPSSSKE